MGKVYSDISNNNPDEHREAQREVRTFTVGDPSMDPYQGQAPNPRPNLRPDPRPDPRLDPQFNPQYVQQNPQPNQGPTPMSYEDAMNFRNQQMQAVQQNNGVARQRAEYLIGSGRLYVDVSVENEGQPTTFTLRSLKGKEMRKLNAKSQALARANDPDLVFMIRTTTIQYALHAIDGSPADMVLGIDNLPEEQKEQEKEEFVDNLDENVLSKLIYEYNKMINEKGFKVETPAQAKEVSEDIKKSS